MSDSSHAGPSANRRQFLSHVGHGVAAAAIGGILATPACSEGQEAAPAAAPAPAGGKKLGYALVGLGKLTINELLPALQQTQHARCVALVSGSADKAKKLAEKFGVDPAKGIYNYENYDTIKDNPEIDVVYIVLPNGMHAEYTVRAFNAGKHVLCEKPMANTVEECRQMLEAQKKANKKLMIAYRLHYEPLHQQARQIVREQQYGPLKVFVGDTGFNLPLQASPWRLNKKLAGGGALLDVGIYALNAARMFAGADPVEVNAQTHTTPGDPRWAEVEESVTFQVKFANGVLANCSTSYAYSGANRYRAMCEKGWLDFEPAISYRGLNLRIQPPGKGVETVKNPGVNQFAAEMDHFAQCVMNDKTPDTPGEEGLWDMRVIEAIYQSAREGKTVKL